MKKKYVVLPIIALLSCVAPFSGHDVYAGEGCTYKPQITNGVCGTDPMGSGNVKVEGGAAEGTVITNKDETYNASINGTTPGTGPSTTTEQTIIPGGTTTTTTEITNSSSNTKPGSTEIPGTANQNQQTGGTTGDGGTPGNLGKNPGDQGNTGSNGGDGATGSGTKPGNSGTNGNGEYKGGGENPGTTGTTSGNGTTGDKGSSGKPGTAGGNTDTKKPVLTKQDLIDAGNKVDTTKLKVEIRVNGKLVETMLMKPGTEGTMWKSDEWQDYLSQDYLNTKDEMEGWDEEERKLDYASWVWKNTTNKDWIRENGDNYRTMGNTKAGTTLKWTLGHGKYDDGTWSIKMTPHYTVTYSKMVKKTVTEKEEYSWTDENGKEHTGTETVTKEIEEKKFDTKKETGTTVEYKVTVPLICSSCPEITICIKGEVDEADGDVEIEDEDEKVICDCGDPYTKCDDADEPKYKVKYHTELSQ